MKKYIFIIVIALIVIVLGVLAFAGLLPKLGNSPSNTEGITVIIPSAKDQISSPLKITGYIDGSGWTGFEGQVGIVKLVDDNNNQLALGILTATSDWMTLPTPFESTIYFDYTGTGDGKLIFYNENASGDPERDRSFTLPVKLTNSSSKTTTVKVYFNNSQMDPEYSCNKVFAVERTMAYTEAPARASLEQLFIGPTNLEKNAGFFTSINEGVEIQSLVIENGIAKVDLSPELNENMGGSCKVSAIRAQIEQTLKQFTSVQSVIISVNGDSENILQP